MKLILTNKFTCWPCPPLHYSAFAFALLYHTKKDISNPPSIAMIITAAATATAVVSVIAGTMKYNICHLLSRSLGFEEKRSVGRKEKYMLSSFAYTSQQPFAYFRKEVNLTKRCAFYVKSCGGRSCNMFLFFRRALLWGTGHKPRWSHMLSRYARAYLVIEYYFPLPICR